jgi:hypothetical protein
MPSLLLAVLTGCGPRGPTDGTPNRPDGNDGRTDDSATDCTPVEHYLDADHDGFGTGDLLSTCDPTDAALVAGDCDDGDAEVHPDRLDVCNGTDDDCDTDVDEDAPTTAYYVDADGDGYGTSDLPMVEHCADAPGGYVAVAGDCDDADASRSPGNAEDWTNGVDDDCDGVLEIETPVEVPESEGAAWDAPTPGMTKLRVLGLYAGGGGDVEVLHDVAEAVVLVLSSSDPVTWVVSQTYAGTIQEIVLNGPLGSAVIGPKDVPVEKHDFATSAYDWDDADTRTLIEKSETTTGLPLTSFHGSYSAPAFTIQPAKEWMDVSAYPDCSKGTAGTAGGAPDPTALDPVACADVLESEHVCVTGLNTTLHAYGLEGGDACAAVTLPSDFGGSPAPSTAWSDEWIYACTGDAGMLQRASLLTGAVEKSYVYCTGVSSFDGALYVAEFPSLKDAPVYATWEDVQCGAPAFYTDPAPDTRLAIEDGVLYSTGHSTDDYDWQVLGGGAAGTETFDDYDGWIWGIDVTDDEWLVFVGEDGIEWVDLDGKSLGGIAVSAGAGYGIACAAQ